MEYPAKASTEKNPRKQRLRSYTPNVPAQKERIKTGDRDAKTPMRGIH